MMMTRALTLAGTTLADAAVDYRADVASVGALVATVVKTPLPVPMTPISGWDSCVAAYVEAKTLAQGWNQDVLVPLTGTPASILRADKAVTKFFDEVAKALNELIGQPDDPAYRAELENHLTGLAYEIATVSGEVADVIAALTDYDASLPLQADDFSRIVGELTAGCGADQARIDVLTRDVADLKSKIDDLSAQIVGLGFAAGMGIVFGAMSFAVGGPAGIVLGILFVGAVAVSAIFIALDAVEIGKLEDDITTDTKEMTQLEADIAALHLAADGFKRLADATKDIRTTLQRIVDAWAVITTAVADVTAQIGEAEEDERAALWSNLQQDLDSARTAWGAALADVHLVDLRLTASDAKIIVGMSSGQVAAALAAHPTVALTDYIAAA